MNDETNIDEVIPPEDLALALQAIASSPGLRIAPIELPGRRVWIKRFDIEPLALAKRLHWLVSPVLYPPFLRGSEPALGEAGVERESLRILAFRAAGFRTPDILYRNGAMLILSDVSPVLTHELAAASGDRRQTLLLKLFTSLGRMHGAGLVHGRPHLRDMSLNNGEICFFDFEEAPETTMPLADAQARDLWLVMLPVVALEPDEKKCRALLQAWLDTAPVEAVCALARFIGFVRPLLALARLLPQAVQGGDLRRFLGAARFLAGSISDMDSAIAGSGQRTASQQVRS
ncbi:MAG: serine/threonine protein phosphatase [Hoeflea sp.]|uniref:serine/threonine protein phosphatase n=1 Tax=Hoeflea sp. TaxID=1940281 RepID=UPI0032EB3965